MQKSSQHFSSGSIVVMKRDDGTDSTLLRCRATNSRAADAFTTPRLVLTSADRITFLNAVQAEDTSFAHVRTSSGAQGYVQTKYLVSAAPHQASPKPASAPSSNFCNRVLAVDREHSSFVPIVGLDKASDMTIDGALMHARRGCSKLQGSLSDSDIHAIASAARLHFMHLSSPDPFGLSEHHAASIHAYTQETDFYHVLNELLRGSDRTKIEPYKPYLKLLMAALHKIPPSAKTLYRGVKKALSQLSQKFEKGKPVVWWAVTSTASHVSVLENEQFLGKIGNRCLFTITSASSRDIQRYSAMSTKESEFVLMPGSCLMVEDILDVGAGLTIVQLAEDVSTSMLQFHHAGHPLAHSAPSSHKSTPAHLQATLPQGWEVLVDHHGQLYYGNPQLKITQYQHPCCGIAQPPLPAGWELLVDQQGRQYYGNPQLKITQYQHPSVMGICQPPAAAASSSVASHAPTHTSTPSQPKPDPPKKESNTGKAVGAGIAALLFF